MKCGTCQYYEPETDQCRRRPPVIIVVKDLHNRPVGVSDWPSVKEDDWCGEWRGKL